MNATYLRVLGRRETTRHVRRYHFAQPGTTVSRCGGGFALDGSTGTPAQLVPASLRCSARPCVTLWIAATRRRAPVPATDLDPHQIIRHGIALDAVDAAEVRRCPRCRRKFALRLTPDRAIACRWESCGYVVATPG